MVGHQALIQEAGAQDVSSGIQGEQTLVSFLRIWASRTPDTCAYSDTPNRRELEIGDPIQLSFADVDKISDEMALQFSHHGLRSGDVLAIQLPNTVELPVTILAALKAGLIPCLYPMLWRSKDLDNAFRMVPARAIVTIGNFLSYAHSEMMCDLAFDHLSVRFIYGVSSRLADGLTDINHFFENYEDRKPSAEFNITPPGLDHPALITWDTQNRNGARPIYRTHRELIAAGLMHVLELELTTHDKLLNPFPLTGLLGLSGMFTPSLLIGGTVIQHHAFDYDAFIKQMVMENATYAAAPAAVLKALVENNIFAHQGRKLKRFGCVWVAPHIKQRNALLASPAPLPVFDIRNLNETAIYIAERKALDEQGQIKLGEVRTKDPSGDDIRLLETRFRGRLNSGDGDRKYKGQLYVRGVAAPKGSGIPPQSSASQDVDDDWINTGLPCTIAENSNKMNQVVCEPQKNVIYHGGIRMHAEELDELYKEFTGFEDAAVISIPDTVLGDRLLVAAQVIDILRPTLDDLRTYLTENGVAPYKYPERLIPVSHIPRDEDGKVKRYEVIKLARNSL